MPHCEPAIPCAFGLAWRLGEASGAGMGAPPAGQVGARRDTVLSHIGALMR